MKNSRAMAHPEADAGQLQQTRRQQRMVATLLLAQAL